MMSADWHLVLICGRVWEDHRGGPTGSGVRAVGVQRGCFWGGAGRCIRFSMDFVNYSSFIYCMCVHAYSCIPLLCIHNFLIMCDIQVQSFYNCLTCVRLFVCGLKMLLPIGSSNELFTHPPPLFPTSRLYNIRPYHSKDKVGEVTPTHVVVSHIMPG